MAIDMCLAETTLAMAYFASPQAQIASHSAVCKLLL
jgi:hypothetical protein